MWMMILSAFLIVFLAGLCYLVIAVSKFGVIRKLMGKSKLLGYGVTILLLGALTAGAALVFSLVNAVIIGLHFVFFFLVFGILTRIKKRFTAKDSRVYWQGWLAIGTTVLYLGMGYYLCDQVWQTDYQLQTAKNVGTIKLALIADVHLGTTFDGEGFVRHLQEIKKQEPDLLLIAGDFVDDSTKKVDFERACEALGAMDLRFGVWYAFGNHDAGYYGSRDFNAKDIRQIMEKNGIHVMEDEYALIDDRFYVVGRRDGHQRDRKEINALLSGIDEEKYVIVINHEPNDYDREAQSSADLVVSGHTHGGQLFPWTVLSKLVKVDDRVYGQEERNGTNFIVTSGISDWEIVFKTGTKSEYVIITIEGN